MTYKQHKPFFFKELLYSEHRIFRGTRFRANPDLNRVYLPIAIGIHHNNYVLGNAKHIKQQKPNIFISGFCTRSGNRTRTRFRANRILSPACLPVPPSEQMIIYYFKQKFPLLGGSFILERKTRFELATPTLARSCSTN